MEIIHVVTNGDHKKDYTATFEKCTVDNGIIDKYIWLWNKLYARNVKNLNGMVWNLPASKHCSHGVKHQFGVIFLRNIL